MVALAKRRYVIPEEYLRREKAAETKSEYANGVIVAMSGASVDHVTITVNLISSIGPALRGKPYRVFSSDLRVRVETANSYYYPDLTIVCGQPKYETQSGLQHLLNPAVVFEVLSNSTEKRDRGEKWLAYRAIDSMLCYVLLHQDRALAEVFTRTTITGEWTSKLVQGSKAILRLPLPEIEIPLAEIYENVDFEMA